MAQEIDTSRILSFNEPGFLGRGFNKNIVAITENISQQISCAFLLELLFIFLLCRLFWHL